MSGNKSILISSSENMEVIECISRLFNVQVSLLDRGLTYLGFCLKPNCYRIMDWYWLVEKFEKHFSLWINRWLSLRSRYILIQSFLQQLMVYWMLLFEHPSHIINRTNSILSHFLWSGKGEHKKYHLVKLILITKGIEMDGLGLLDLRRFDWALLVKSL